MKHPIHRLTALTLLSIAASGVLWSAAFFLSPPRPPLALAGTAAAALAMCLVWSLSLAHRRALAELERRHREELEAQQRGQSEALAQASATAREEMDAFRSRLAHTLRMPVAIIQGYADLLTSGVVTESAVRDEYLKKISDRSQYMTEAISRQFAAGSSLDSSRLNYSDLDLLTLIRQAAADMQTAAADQGITIQVLSTQTHIPIRADGYLIDRVLFNLLENSLKYMGRPGVITIRAERQDRQVLLRVQDDGLGLPAEETVHIFEPNYQGSNHTKGQGYGLYLVRQTIESHGGTIFAQSSPGHGMGIVMTLPAAPDEAGA